VKITMTVSIAGTRNGVEWPPAGGDVDLPDGEAEDLIAGGLAVAADPKAKAAPAAVETASLEAPENAAKPKPRARKATGMKTTNTP
jgi:hypothetical protein